MVDADQSDEPLDFEDVAIRQLRLRARRIRMRVGVASVSAGVVAGALTAWAMLTAVGEMPALVWGLLFVIPLLGCTLLGLELVKLLIRRRGRGWAGEMAERYQLEVRQLYAYIRQM
jgi:hypothetical protein